MTMTTPQRDRVRRALGVFVEEAPPAPDWEQWRQPQLADHSGPARLRGPIVAIATAAVALVVIGGAVAFLRATPNTATTNPGNIETRGDWYDAVASTAQANGPDATIVQGALGPEPQFDTSHLGAEQTLEPVTQIAGDVPWNSFFSSTFVADRGTLIVAGRVESSLIGFVPATYDHLGQQINEGLCYVIVSPELAGNWGSSVSCGEQSDPIEYGIGGGSIGSDIGLSDSIAVVVPPPTSVVLIESATTQSWQRPRGGMALFVGNFSNGEIRYTAYSASGQVLSQGTREFGN